MSTTLQPSPVLLTSGDLISQDEQFIKEYAAYFKLPTNLNRSELLEKICQLHPGSAPCIPVLPHLTFERVNGGKIRFTGRVSAGKASQPPAVPVPTRPALPANRRLVRHSDLVQAMIEAQERGVPSEPSSGEDTPLPQTPVDVALPQQASVGEEAPENQLNMEHKVDTVLRFPTPVDEFDPPRPRRERPSGSPDSAASSLLDIPPKRRMKFVYPPVPRTPTDPEVPRAFSPGDTWVEKMYMDLARGRRDVKNDLEEVKREVRDAMEEVMKAEIEFKEEMQSTQKFIGYLQRIASAEWTDEIIQYATRIAEHGSSDSEALDEAEDESGDEDAGDGDGDNGGGSGDDGDSSSDDDAEDGPGSRDDGDGPERREDEDEHVKSDEGSDNDEAKELLISSRSNADHSPSGRPVHTTTSYPGPGTPSRGTRNRKRERDDDDDSDDGRNTGEVSPSCKRAKSSHDHGAPASERIDAPRSHTALEKATSSPSLKRPRDDDDNGSELEVELSIRRSGSESSLSDHGRSPKKARSENGTDAGPRSHSGATPSPSSSPRARLAIVPQVGGSASSSSGPWDEEGSPANGWPAGLFGSYATYDDSASEDDEDGADFFGRSAPFPGWRSAGAFSPPPDGPRFSYPPGRGPSQSQPAAGPSNPQRKSRPLTRSTERIRETADGGIEAYNYEEDPQWLRRMKLQELTMKAVKAHPGYGVALPPEEDFSTLRMPTGWNVESVSEDDEEGG
ncbi:hypothetical protein LshimejAT787_1203450 [Lyophyllum shimeji]|uniref:Uncharacterized protein n=1 Tax=Lyophyllum shimeji TaxID=47721 RepID=A0A9P3UU73_LYOSH|nr:hypothetical protein LshimejAT787_1203450 [Lyophyllum shimeji]